MRTSLRLLALFIGLGAIWPLAPAHAQTAQATVVATCGTLVTPYVAGQSFPLTMDVTGVLCTASTGGGGGGAVTMANGASVTLGNTADAAYTGSGSATEIAILKGIYSSVNGSIPAGTNSIGAVTSIDGGITTIGLEADAAYAGSGSTTVIGGLKGIYAAATAPLAAGTNSIGTVVVPSIGSQYPTGATVITASPSNGTTGAVVATLTPVSGHTAYLCGFAARANATAAATVNLVVSGTITGSLNFLQWIAPAASGIGLTEEIFTPCVPASAVTTNIVVTTGAPGSGGNDSVSAWGYSL